MMKNKFFSGLSAKLALATVALAALTFTSCDKEPFNTQIIYNPARVIITPNVQYVDMASGTAKDVTSSATITFSGSTSNGIIEGTTTNPSIAAGSVNITASYNGLTGSTTVATPALQTGVVTITPTIFIIKSDVYVLGAPTKVGDDESVTLELEATESAFHDGRYIENASEYFLPITIKYPVKNYRVQEGDAEIVDTEDPASVAAIIQRIVNGLTKDGVTFEEYKYNLSAWAIFTASVTQTSALYKYPLYRVAEDGTQTLVGTFVMKESVFSKLNFDEQPHPSHAAHYEHGHGHGTSTNAGGGIINAD
ncbi:MAG: DUF3869 domain-containing protein [Phocaeicola sp.]|nr:DUF3869 domain-containing protein [Phocaeicola sp.]